MLDGVDLDRAPVVLVQRRWQTALMTLAAALVAAVGMTLWRGQAWWFGAAVTILFGLFAAVGLAQVISPSQLTIDRSGLRFDEWFRSRSWPWGELANFHGVRGTLWFEHQGRLVSLQLLQGIIGMAPAGWRGGLRLISALKLSPVLEAARARWS
ncbi:PH domain-containing protein [Phenylobacterium sp.]|jgi:hypothetical protein|uniref:PH domain-containing protein n=1 Tax=Phenylobacterium sp. TaxID=1871053 RepID=UPI002F426A3F